MWVAIAAHTGIFCFLSILDSFGNYDIRYAIRVIPLQIIVLEHIVFAIAIIPMAIAAFLTSRKNIRILLSFCINTFVTSFILFFTAISVLSGINDSHGWGNAIFGFLFMSADAAFAVIGAICGLAYIVKKVLGWHNNRRNTQDRQRLS
jgi:hypothetical protein